MSCARSASRGTAAAALTAPDADADVAAAARRGATAPRRSSSSCAITGWSAPTAAGRCWPAPLGSASARPRGPPGCLCAAGSPPPRWPAGARPANATCGWCSPTNRSSASPDPVDPMRTATGHQVPVQCVVPALTVRRRGRVLVSPTGTLTPESLLGAVISAIRRGQQLLRVVIGHLASSSVVVGHAAPIGSAWPPSAWHRGPCPCGHYALPGDAALNHAAYYRHVVAP